MEPDEEAVLGNHLGGGGIGLGIFGDGDEVRAEILYGGDQHESPQVLHAAALVKEDMNTERIGRVGGHRRPGGGSPGRFFLRLFAAATLNFIHETINFIYDTVDRIRERFAVFDLLNLAAEEIHRLKEHIEQFGTHLHRHRVHGLLPDDEEEVLDTVCHRHQGRKLHHSGRTLDGMHDAENLIHTVLGERIRLLSGQQNAVQLLQQGVRLV